MKYFDLNFIPQNCAPYNAESINIYDNNGNKVCNIPLGHLALPNLGEKLYSFLGLADIHQQYETGLSDHQNALTYANDSEHIDFVIEAGDLTGYGTIAELQAWKDCVDTYLTNKPIYAIPGNHDASETSSQTPVTFTYEGITPYTGYPLYYTFEKGDDLFIMFGTRRWDAYNGWSNDPFDTESLQWLYETLEANRNRRVFVVQHMLRLDGCGNPLDLYTMDMLNGTQGTVFKSLMEHYKNVHWLHGHSHTSLDLQAQDRMANYDREFGCHSWHFPSLTAPRDITDSSLSSVYAESEGVIIDVYENHIVYRGINFITEEFLPIATYCVETALTTIEAGTYTDGTGTITT